MLEIRSNRQALLLAFLLGLGARLQVQIIGFLPFSELFVGMLFPVLLPLYLRLRVFRAARLLVPLCLLWLGSTIISDLYWGTAWSLAARGVARVLVFLTAIPFTIWFFASDARRKLICFTLGLILSVVLSAYVFRSGAQVGRELVWGSTLIRYETHWVMVVVFVAQLINLLVYHRSQTVAYAASLLAGSINFYNGSRAAGAVFVIGVPVALARNVLAARRARNAKLSPLGLMLLFAATCAIAWGVIEAYSYTASEGILGEMSRRKFEAQSGTPAGLLLTGRVEIVGAVLAVQDAPILGHGSWKLDTDRYYAKALNVMEIATDPSFYYARGYPLIPSHSHLMGAWVENGLAGGIFWAYALLIVARALYRPLVDERHLRLWVSCAATALVWHIVFSPISGRLETAVTLAVFLTQADAAMSAAALRRRIGAMGSGSVGTPAVTDPALRGA